MVHLGDEPGFVSLHEGAGDLQVDEKVLADRQGAAVVWPTRVSAAVTPRAMIR